MAIESIKGVPATAGTARIGADLLSAAAAIAAGWRAASDHRHLSAANRNAAPQQVVRAVFERHFA